MPYAIEIDPRARIAYLIGTGATNPDEGHATLVELAAHPDFEPGFGLVCDLRGLDLEPTETPELTMGGFENVVRFKPLLRSRMGIVVGPEQEMLSELSAALYATAGLEARVFRGLDEARAWVKEATVPETAA
ncbi:MAG: hypothetical protein JRH16_00515 [Deltaproteobacteria bacterium]|nr:hypothetical protein [Deltaproteobacteria bacterium]MBW2359445.1 hypothetical protein [Deltaproteobacteria bacterium]